MEEITLNGAWQICVDPRREGRPGALPWTEGRVPHCCEADGGLVWYRRNLALPPKPPGREWYLCFAGADYRMDAWLNGVPLGGHEGGFAPFRLPLSAAGAEARYGGDNELLIRVENQAAAPREGAIYIKETRAGFLCDTIGVNYCGLWGDVALRAYGEATAEELFALPDLPGERVLLRARLRNDGPTRRELALNARVREGDAVRGTSAAALSLEPGEARELELPLALPGYRPWTPAEPQLYLAELDILDGGALLERQRVRFGMRSVAAAGNRLLVNGQPTFLCGFINWMMDYRTLAPKPDPERVRREIRDLRAEGFNAVKFCLVTPPEEVLDAFDELGMYAYIEYPVWNPELTPAFYRRAYAQLPELIRKDRNHPCVVMSDFNCEMHAYSPEMEALMRFAVTEGRRIAPNRLYLDNSSCGVERFGDFWATHPYEQLNQFARAARAWEEMRLQQGVKPLVFGEYADTDALRDTERVRRENGGQDPWWWARFGTPDPVRELEKQGFSAGEIRRLTDQSALNAAQCKKYYLEESRKCDGLAALFLTHIRDVAQTQAGFYDEMGEPRFPAGIFAPAAGPTALLLDRRTQHGFAGETLRVTPALSHFGPPLAGGRLAWALLRAGEPVARGERQVEAGAGFTAWEPLELPLPPGGKPERLTLSLQLRGQGLELNNAWEIWTYPRPKGGLPAAYYDPDNLLDLPRRDPGLPAWQPGSAARVVIATAWRPELEPYLRAGGRLLFLGEGAGPLRSTSVAHYFNRFCCLHAPEPGHPLLRDLPTDAPGALFFLDLATSRQIDGWEGGVLQRVDCRTCGVNSYLAEYAVGAGRVLHTTLRLHDRAVAEEEIVSYEALHLEAGENALGAYLLDRMVRYLAS